MFNKAKPATAQPRKEPNAGSSVIGPTLQFIGGRLTSDEDLIIEGTVEGTIAHQNHELRIGATGKVKADVHARVIIIEGTIEGNMHGDEAVEIRSTARVVGDVVSPRVSIADGASFEGRIKTSREKLEAKLPEKRDPMTEFTGSLGVRARRKERADEHSEAGTG